MILDTNALSACAEDNASVITILAETQHLAIPVIVMGEYRYGIALSRHRVRYERWVEAFIADCAVLDVDEHTTHHYAAISIELRMAGKPIPANDLWIAALCRQHKLPILSRDRHFDEVKGVRRFDW